MVGHLDSQRTGIMCTEDKKTKERDLFVEPIRQPEENYIFFQVSLSQKHILLPCALETRTYKEEGFI